ncbi:MAG: radical SAM protein [Pseudomonadota bacterium]
MDRWAQVERLRALKAREGGEPLPAGGPPVALLYPASYRVGMASLGYQWIAHLLAEAGFAVERAFLPDEGWRPEDGPILTLESERPLGDFPLVAATVAWELELPGLVRALEASGIPAPRAERGPEHPALLLGGPLTFSNPRPLAAIADALLLGEADATVIPAVQAFFALDRVTWEARFASLEGGWAPHTGQAEPEPARAADALLPARARLWSPEADFADMALVEAERGCSRACAFCVMRRGEGPGMRVFAPERVLAAVPAGAPRVGLVGAAVGDHPRLTEILTALLDRGQGVGVSSLRADRLARQPDLAGLLRRAGYQTLTIAADAPSERLRVGIHKGIRAEDLLACSALAREHGFRAVKLYAMLGLPGETDEDVEELAALLRAMAAIHPVDLALSPFVPKRRTPLAGAQYAGIKVVERRVARLERALRGVAGMRPVSARWAWVEAMLAQGGPEAGLAAVRATRAGGGFSAWKRALRG